MNYISKVPETTQKPYEISASVGTCCEKITGRINTEGMLSRADQLMYQNKVERKKNRRE